MHTPKSNPWLAIGAVASVFALANSKVPVVPCQLEGYFHSWPPGGHFVKPTCLRIKIGMPVTFEDCTDDRAGWNFIAKRLHQCVENLSR